MVEVGVVLDVMNLVYEGWVDVVVVLLVIVCYYIVWLFCERLVIVDLVFIGVVIVYFVVC